MVVRVLRLFPCRCPASVIGSLAGAIGGAGDRLLVDLSAQGRRAHFPGGGAFPRQRPLRMASATLPSPAKKAARVPAGDEIFSLALFLIFALVPVVATLGSQAYLLGLFARMMVFAISAVSLDVLGGFGVVFS